MKTLHAALLGLMLAIAGSARGEFPEEEKARAAEQAENYRAAAWQYTYALQKAQEGSADEQRLMERAIDAAKRVSPPLSGAAGDAAHYMARGTAAVEMAKTPEDYRRAAVEFGRAGREAPWYADAHYNRGVVQEKAGQFDAAMQSFRLYLRAAPDAPDAQAVAQRISALGYKAERQREQRAADQTTKAARSYDDLAGNWRDQFGQQFLLKIEGNAYTMTRVMGCWGTLPPAWGQCANLRPESTVMHFGTIVDGVFTGHSFNPHSHKPIETYRDGSSAVCPVPAGNYPIYQGELSPDRRELTIMATDQPTGRCSPFRFGSTYRR